MIVLKPVSSKVVQVSDPLTLGIRSQRRRIVPDGSENHLSIASLATLKEDLEADVGDDIDPALLAFRSTILVEI